MTDNNRDGISQEQYVADFKDRIKKKRALEHALDIRKFEIDLYWKRAAYFWTFIGATFAGYGAIEASSSILPTSRADLSVILSCLGVVFSFGWYCANRGSKQWQENWENHVDMLEDDIIGPLYKTVLKRPRARGWKLTTDMITGPGPYSVSKINQVISLFVTVLWVVLLWTSLPTFSRTAAINWEYVVIVGATLATCAAFLLLGRTHEGAYLHIARRRKTEIQAPDAQQILQEESSAKESVQSQRQAMGS